MRDLVQSLTAVREKIAEHHRTMAKAMSDGFESSLKEILGRLSAIQIPQEYLTERWPSLSTLGRRGKFSNAAQRLETSLLRAAESVTSFGDSLHGSEGAKQVGMAVNDLSMKIKGRTEQFLKMTTTFEQSRADLDGQLISGLPSRCDRRLQWSPRVCRHSNMNCLSYRLLRYRLKSKPA